MKTTTSWFKKAAALAAFAFAAAFGLNAQVQVEATADVAYLYRGAEQVGSYSTIAAALDDYNNKMSMDGTYTMTIVGGAETPVVYEVADLLVKQSTTKIFTIKPVDGQKVTLKYANGTYGSIFNIWGGSTYETLPVSIDGFAFDISAPAKAIHLLGEASDNKDPFAVAHNLGTTGRYVSYLVITNCSFFGGADSSTCVDAQASSAPSAITVCDCVCNNVGYFVNAYAGNYCGYGFKVNDCHATNCKVFFNQVGGNGLINVKDSTALNHHDYSVRANAALTVSGCAFTNDGSKVGAFIEVRKVSNDIGSLTISDTSFDDLSTGTIHDMKNSNTAATTITADGTVAGVKYNNDSIEVASGAYYDFALLSTPVCKIGTTEYMTLAEAIAAAEDGTATTIQMIADVEYGDVATPGYAVQIPAAKNIVLDLNGQDITLARTTDVSECIIQNLGTLTVTDTSANADGTMTVTYAKASDPGSVTSAAISTKGTFTLAGGNLVSGTGRASYGIDCLKGTCTISGGTITSSYQGVRVYPQQSNSDITFEMNGGKMTAQSCLDVQGGASSASVVVNGGELVAEWDPIYVWADDSEQATRLAVNVTGGKITAGSCGILTLDTTVTNNTQVAILSGGVYTANTCTLLDGSDEIPFSANKICASGFEITASGDPDYPYTAKEKKYVAQIGETKYQTIQAAVTAAANGDTIQMIADVACDDSATICAVPKGKTVTLDLNGKKIASTGSYAKAFDLFQVFGGLTLRDTSEGQTGEVSITSSVSLSWDYAVNVFWVGNGGALLVESGNYTISTPDHGYAEYVICASNNNGSSDVIINGGTFVGNNIDAVIRLHDQDDRTGTQLNVTLNGGDFTLNGSQCDSVVWLDVQCTGDENTSDCDLTINGGTFTSNSASPALDIGHVGDSTTFDVAISGGTFKSNGKVIKTRELSAEAIANIKVSGGTYSSDPTDYVVAGRVANKVSILGTDWWVVGEIVDTGDNTTAVVVVDHSSSVDEEQTAEVISDPTAAEKFNQNTTVTGVKLVETNETVATSGTQAVVDKARLEGTAAFRDNLKKAANVLVNVDVSVKPTIYVAPAQETKAGEIAFTLTPVATVTVDEGGTDKTEEVEVTNEMIDTLQDIVVTVYTGFKPEQAFHTGDDGTVIDTFAGDEIAYDETTGNASVTIHHFSSLTFTQKPAVASVNGTPYATLAAAFAAAEDDETVTLLTNVVLDACIVVSNEVTLDIGAYNVTATDSFATGTTKDALFAVRYGGDLTVNGTTGAITSGAHAAAIKLTEKGETFASERAKLTVNGGTITGSYYAIVGNGDRPGTDIVINGGTLTATYPNDNLGIFNPQGDSTVVVNGGTIIGYATAIEMRGGQLTVNGGTLTATASEYSCAGAGDGTTTVGAAVAVVQHTTGNAVGAVVNGGTLTGKRALSEANPASGSAVVTLAVSNGVFNGTVASASVRKYISGGTFSEAVAQEQCVDWFKPVDNGDGTYGVAEQAVFLQNLHGATRYPWNGKVDVTFQLQAARDVKLFVAAFDANSNRVSMTKADLVAPYVTNGVSCVKGFVGVETGTNIWANYHLVWDSAQSVPSNKLEGVSFKVFAR